MFVSNGVIHIVAARALATAAYGRFALALLCLSWLSPVAMATILPGLRKIVTEDRNRLPAALTFALKWHSLAMLVLAAVFCGTAPLIARALNDSKLTPLLLLVGLQIPLIGFIWLSVVLLESIQRFLVATAIRSAHSLLRMLGACVCVLLGLGATGGIAGTCVGAALGGMASAFMLLRARAGLTGAPSPGMSQRASYWTAVSLPHVFCSGALLTLDLWFVKGMEPDPAAAGIYAAAYALSHFLLFLGQGLGGAAFPKVSGALAAGEVEVARTVAA